MSAAGFGLTEAPRPEAAVAVAERTSPGGIAFWHVEDDTVPLVALRFGFRGGGAVRDPHDLPGVANLATGLLDEGAGPHDAMAFQTLLEDNAIQLAFDGGHDTLSGELTMVSTMVGLGADLLGLALTAPRFDADAIERGRAQVMAGLRRELNEPEAIASRLSAQTFYPGHPYGRPVSGTLETVPALTAENLRTHHGAALGRDRLVVAVVGAIGGGAAGDLVDRAFGGLPAAAAPHAVPDIAVPAGIVHQHERDIAQTIIRFALPAVGHADPDFIAAVVLNHILGGGTFASRLFRQVRQERGLTYSVYSRLALRDHAASLTGGASTRPERAQETLDVIRQVIAALRDDGPTPEEIALAHDFLIGSYPLRFDSSRKIARQLVAMQFDGRPVSYMTERAALIRAVGADDVRRVADRILNAPLSLVIVGRPLT